MPGAWCRGVLCSQHGGGSSGALARLLAFSCCDSLCFVLGGFTDRVS